MIISPAYPWGPEQNKALQTHPCEYPVQVKFQTKTRWRPYHEDGTCCPPRQGFATRPQLEAENREKSASPHKPVHAPSNRSKWHSKDEEYLKPHQGEDRPPHRLMGVREGVMIVLFPMTAVVGTDNHNPTCTVRKQFEHLLYTGPQGRGPHTLRSVR